MKSDNVLLPNSPPNARIGILGGSFDPPHLGHQLLGLSALATSPIDELWVMPCASHAFDKSLTSFEHRLHMCQLAFSHLKNTHVTALESSLSTPSRTINTLLTILKQRPDLKLSFVMGSDLLEHFDRWEGADQIRQLVKLVVFDRATLLPGVQSSQIRERIQHQDFLNLDQKVVNYILEHGLYGALLQNVLDQGSLASNK